jgi:hypothetical protein
MGTRSNIIYEEPTGEVLSMYCHYDGYPSHNGRILFDQYNSAKKAKALVEIGYARVLDEGIEVDPERPNEMERHRNLNSFMWSVDTVMIEYIYRYAGDDWWMSEIQSVKPEDAYMVSITYHSKFKLLSEVLEEVDAA